MRETIARQQQEIRDLKHRLARYAAQCERLETALTRVSGLGTPERNLAALVEQVGQDCERRSGHAN